MAIDISGKNITIKNIYGEEFIQKYGFKCPTGVRGRNSDNRLFRKELGWEVSNPLIDGMTRRLIGLMFSLVATRTSLYSFN
jgi:GDP-D-mannose 3',5'-epimerase